MIRKPSPSLISVQFWTDYTITAIGHHYVCFIHQKSSRLPVMYWPNVLQMALIQHLSMPVFLIQHHQRLYQHHLPTNLHHLTLPVSLSNSFRSMNQI
jgi:hypothetical protein